MNAIQRMILHPAGSEDEHESIFAAYAASNAWVATHFAEFLLVLVALAGLLVLCRALRPETPYLALLAAGAIIASGAAWAALQAVDGITLKQTVDAWAAASGPEKATRYADAETTRWIEWGLQGYFRVLLGVAFLLFSAAVVLSRLRPELAGRAPRGRRPALPRHRVLHRLRGSGERLPGRRGHRPPARRPRIRRRPARRQPPSPRAGHPHGEHLSPGGGSQAGITLTNKACAWGVGRALPRYQHL